MAVMQRIPEPQSAPERTERIIIIIKNHDMFHIMHVYNLAIFKPIRKYLKRNQVKQNFLISLRRHITLIDF